MLCCALKLPALIHALAQTDIKDASLDSTGDDFLARERAVLGDDANQFVTPGDSSAFSPADDNLLGSAEDSNHLETAQFESSFPDLASQNQVSFLCVPST